MIDDHWMDDLIGHSTIAPVERIKAASVRVSITVDVRKLCPVKDEIDKGTAVIVYGTRDQKSHGAIELHSLRIYLDGFTTRAISHEDFTALIARELRAEVTTYWSTAGMSVECRSV